MKKLLEQLTDRLWAGPIRRWHTSLKVWQHSRFEAGHIFSIDIDGVRFEMTFLDYHLGSSIVERIEGNREPETVAIEKTLVRSGDKVLELGGCYGYFTAILSHCVGPRGRVVSIEGTPNNYRILKENIRLNNLANVRSYNVFLTSRSEEVWFGEQDKVPYHAIRSLTDGPDATEHDVVVPSVRLTSFLTQIDFVPDHILMDIEGFEVEVLDDLVAHEYLKACRPTILFEIHDQFYEKGRGLDYVLGLLESTGYECRRIAGNLLCLPLAVDAG